MKGSECVFNYVHLLYYKCHEINLICDGLYIDSPDWIKHKATRNPVKKKDNKCFQYTVTVALNHKEIKKYLQRIARLKPFRNKCNRERINFSSENMIGKKLRKNNVKIALNVAIY